MPAGQLVEFFLQLALQHWSSRLIAQSRQTFRDTGPDVVRIGEHGDHGRRVNDYNCVGKGPRSQGENE